MPDPGRSVRRLRHEGRVHVAFRRHLLDDQPIGHHRVGHRQGVGVAQIDLVLRRCNLVVRELDGDTHLLEHTDRVAAQLLRHVQRGQVEIAAGIDG